MPSDPTAKIIDSQHSWRASERAALNSAVPDQIVFTLDVAGNFKSINSAGEKVCGYSFQELRAMNIADLLPSDSVHRLREITSESTRERFGVVYEIDIVTKDLRRVTVETSAQLVRRESGVVEFEGIAVPAAKWQPHRGARPRCLHEQFKFEAFSATEWEDPEPNQSFSERQRYFL